MSRSLKGKVAVVTGAGSGMGRAIAVRLAADGAAVAIWDINGPGAAETAKLITEAGGAALAFTVDCADRPAIEAAAAETRAALAAGFPDSSSYYRKANDALGMTAKQYRKGEVAVRYAIDDCWLGRCLVAESERGICAILLGDTDAELTAELATQFPKATHAPRDDAFVQRIHQVIASIDNRDVPLALPLDIRGTAFQQRVWQALRAIPCGETASYQQVAQAIGQPSAVRAVAGACAANTLAIVIPCHRVVRNDGALSGYRWGAARKALLLKREAKRREG